MAELQPLTFVFTPAYSVQLPSCPSILSFHLVDVNCFWWGDQKVRGFNQHNFLFQIVHREIKLLLFLDLSCCIAQEIGSPTASIIERLESELQQPCSDDTDLALVCDSQTTYVTSPEEQPSLSGTLYQVHCGPTETCDHGEPLKRDI